MKTTMFQTAARRTAAISRRGSVKLLGAAALTGALAAPAAAAKKNGNKDNKRCKRQRGQCLAYSQTLCDAMLARSGQSQEGLPTCKEQLASCCEHFARCNAGQGIECLFDKVLVG